MPVLAGKRWSYWSYWSYCGGGSGGIPCWGLDLGGDWMIVWVGHLGRG